jgi:hypothetical protein
MLQLDHAAVIVADRERDIAEAARARQRPVRPSYVARARDRLAEVLRPASGRQVHRSPRTLARGFGKSVNAASARAGDTHGQGAC